MGAMLVAVGLICSLSPAVLLGQSAPSSPPPRNDLLSPSRFIQIPGPNPLITHGPEGAWDDGVVETADAFKNFGTYYLYYHGTKRKYFHGDYEGNGYRLGVATATHPLGPFKKYGDKPILELGPQGSWDDEHVACAMILKEGLDWKKYDGLQDTYYMWYSATGSGLGDLDRVKWSVGLATAPDPLGPWTKYEGNPVVRNFGYVGGVVKANGKYYMYTEHPIGSSGPDYGSKSVALSDSPEGPWTIMPEPVLRQGDWGEWDDGGVSEAEVLYSGGVFHMFYGGAKLYRPRLSSRESIGYAYSFDGINFTKYGRNPVATRHANPNAASFSEVHGIFELPFIYLYHTLRYKEPLPEHRGRFPSNSIMTSDTAEDLGVQVLVTARPFKLDMPVLTVDSLDPKSATELAASPPVSLSHADKLSVTAECTYNRNAKEGLRLHVRSSTDGMRYDTTDLYTLDMPCQPGQLSRKTFELKSKVRFIKVIVENRDPSESVSDVKVTATLGG